ncbi:zinc-binding dehydrogenase [Actinoplanes sp. L3-i22]|uniref:zinc-binding dehydrogenase n=1 Tax=Actinoplanes sp. L3-i22 TaxID=2836373 RepID=UPI001C760644|nr:zinc-binding dehydrogenase [Actinoplanes sp. L3-i22]BCY10078.1 oxidoreductase [Actinoplanes sp. L3-i22]
MQAVRIQTFGDPGGMAVVDVPEPVPAPGQLLVGTEAIGVGGVDAVIRRGTLSGYGFREGLIPGSEIAGRVLAVGDGVDATWIGREVWAFTGVGGAYAERAVAALDDVTPLPAGLSPIAAVTLGSSAPVAHFALAHAHFAAGESVLIRGAAGSIGVTAIQLAARAGASRIAVTTSSPERGKRLQELGATTVLDRSGETPEEFDVILDIVGGPALPSFLDRLADNGRLVAVGVVGGHPPADFGMHLMRAFQRSRSFATFSLNTIPVPSRNEIRAAHLAAAAQGTLRPVVHEVLDLTDAAQAHRQMDAGDVFGRIVLTTHR